MEEGRVEISSLSWRSEVSRVEADFLDAAGSWKDVSRFRISFLGS